MGPRSNGLRDTRVEQVPFAKAMARADRAGRAVVFPAIALSCPLAWGAFEPGAAPPLAVGGAVAGAAIVVAARVYAVWRARREGRQ